MIRLQPRSIRQKLTLWYTGILAGLLLLFGGGLYLSMTSGLLRNLDRTLAIQADSMADALRSFQEAERTAAGNSPGNWSSAPLEGRPAENLSALVKRWSAKTGVSESGQMFSLVDRYGQTLTASAGFQRFEKPLSEHQLQQAFQGHTLFETVRYSRQKFRTVTRPIYQYGRIRYLIRTVSPMTPLQESLRQLRFWMFWLVPWTLLLAAVGGWFLADGALKPVVRMIHEAESIGAQALDHRVAVPETGDELERLGKTFNEMLGRVEEAFRRQRQFGAAASHELRTPLTVMRGELELALRRPRSAEEYQRVLSTHLQAVHEMAEIVEELLLLARADVLGELLEWRPIELGQLVRNAGIPWGKIAQEKKVRIEYEGTAPVRVRGETRLLERLVSNLLDNAIRNTPAGGTIVARVDYWRNRACLVVQDSGSGIPPDILPQIFDRFFSRPAVGSAGSSSMGIGLGLCRWIAEVHRGRIEVSNRPGGGAQFTVWFPLQS